MQQLSENKKNFEELDELKNGSLSSRLDELAEAKKSKTEKEKKVDIAGFFRSLGEDISYAVSTTRFRRGGAAAALTALFLVFVVLANLVAVKLTDRFAFLSPDLTANQIYTLSDVTLELLEGLDEHVEIDIIATEAMCKYSNLSVDPYGHIPLAAELIERYAQCSDNIRIFYIDITQNPGFLDLVPEYRESISDYSIIVRSEKRTRVTSFYEVLPSLSSSAYTDSASVDTASSLTEMYISSLIKTVTLDVVPAVAYLDCLGGGDYIDNLLDALSLNGYDIYTSSDFAFGYEDIPEAVQMVIIGAPDYDITLAQLDQLAEFLDNGGKYGKTLLVFSTPYMREMPNLSTLLNEWGMNLQRSTVYEGTPSQVLPMQNADIFYATYMDSEYITDSISEHETVINGALNIEIPYQVIGNIVVNGVLSTSSVGYLSDVSKVFDEAEYTAADGAVRCIMADSTLFGDGSEGSIRSDVILAPISLLNSNFFGSSLVYNNFALAMNVCNQRCGITDEGLDIASKSLTATDFSVDASAITLLTVIFSYAVPLTVAVIGAVVCVRRKRL